MILLECWFTVSLFFFLLQRQVVSKENIKVVKREIAYLVRPVKMLQDMEEHCVYQCNVHSCITMVDTYVNFLCMY